MAMTDEMDELLRLYRHASKEAPSAQVDTRILLAADRVVQTQRWSRRIAWPAAIAASLLLWAIWPASHQHMPVATDRMAGYDAGMSHAELLRMDVTPPGTEVDRFVLNAPYSRPQPTTGNAP